MEQAQAVQSFGDIRIEGQSNTFIINQVVQISVSEIQLRPLIATSPYLGLRRFEERNKDLFFGRDRWVAELLQLCAEQSLILVAGASGSGKSSVVRAGLLPQLASRLPQGRFRSLVMTPDRDPFASLRAALRSAGIAQEKIAGLRSGTAESLGTELGALRPRDELWLLVIDQFEELFTLCESAELQREFLGGLTRLAATSQPDLKVVLCMRADFLDRLSPFPEFALYAERGLRLITDLKASELRAAIEQPAARHGVIFEAGLVDQIIADVQGHPGTLPLLQYTLDLLWREDRPEDDRTLNTATYHRLGGVEGALGQRADLLYRYEDVEKQVPRPHKKQEALRRVFLRLADLAGQRSDARVVSRRAPIASFASADERSLIDELVEESLLVSSQGAVIAIAHEALLHAWPLLKSWIDEAREVLYIRNRLSADAARWQTVKSQNPALADEELWSGTRLSSARELRDSGDFQAVLGGLTAEESAFLDVSLSLLARREAAEAARREELRRKDEEKREQRVRFLRLGAWIFGSLFLGTSGLAIYANRQRVQARLEKDQEQLAKEKAERERARAEQNELASYVEEGRQLLVEREQPTDALLWLSRAYSGGSQSPVLRYLLADALRSLNTRRLVFLGHRDAVVQVDISRDGTRIVTASADHTARIWNAQSGALIVELKGHAAALSTALFSPNGQLVLTASHDGSARIWDAQSGRATVTLSGHTDKILAADWSADGSRVVTAGDDGTGRVWDVLGGKQLCEYRGHGAAIYSAAFSPDGTRVLTASGDETAQIWLVKSGKLVAKLLGHAAPLWSGAWSPDGRRVVTASGDSTGRIYETTKGRLIAELKGHQSAVTSAWFSPDGGRILTASWDQTARLWDAGSGAALRVLGGQGGTVTSARFSSDGKRAVTASAAGLVRVWELGSGRLLDEFKEHGDRVGSAAFSPDGSWVVSASLDRTARSSQVSSGKRIAELGGHGGRVGQAAWSPDGKLLLTGADAARLWDAASGKLLRELGAGGRVAAALFSPNGDSVFVAAERGAQFFSIGGKAGPALQGRFGAVGAAELSQDGTRLVTGHADQLGRLWDARSGALVAELRGHPGAVSLVRFSGDGRRVLTASTGEARVWDAGTGKLLAESGPVTPIYAAAISRDGMWVVVGGVDTRVRLWRIEPGQRPQELPGHTGPVLGASFAGDGRRFVTASADRTARLWTLDGPKLLLELKGHALGVESAVFSQDGLRVVTTSEDRLARLWSAESGQLLGELVGHGDRVGAASFSPDGRRLVTASWDGTARIWDVGEELRAAGAIDSLIRCRLPYVLRGYLVMRREDNYLAGFSAAPCDSMRMP